ncbi:hypothetical protein GCM10022276_28280 [Sphingomonas limnosediminicola]|uniref:DUF4239 domain-containing protein n=1 Tax=Sphingomonas limnosediminicola TaxID=940133 RepID=A0ABP7LVN0_9SPHN
MSELILKVIPFWLFGLLLVSACVIASELGRVVRRKLPSRPDADFPSDIQGYVVGAVFGLLALLMALTFSIAINRYDERRGWVAQEANAINTTFLRASLLDEPFRTQIQSTLRMYAHSRISPDGIWDERMNARLAQSHQIQDRLWNEAHAALYPIRTTELASYFVVSLNETLDIGTRRELAGRTHIPARIFNSLLLYLLGASFILGFVTGSGSIQARLTFAVLFILFAIAIMMIVDLDSAQAGAIRVPQTAMKDLVTALDKVKLEPGRAE